VVSWEAEPIHLLKHTLFLISAMYFLALVGISDVLEKKLIVEKCI
jgi:hypothetical protein